MRKLITAVGLLGAMLPGVAGGAEIFEKVGTFDGQFLKIGIGARAAAMGGAFVAVADDASALYWNAAGIARVESDRSQLQFNHLIWPADIKYTQLGYVFHTKRIPGAFGISLRSLYMDPMIETTAYQPDPRVGTGRTFDAGYMAAGLTYARSFTDKFSAGVTATFVHEGLADLSQNTYAFDLGTLYDVGTMGMRIGMAIANIYASLQLGMRVFDSSVAGLGGCPFAPRCDRTFAPCPTVTPRLLEVEPDHVASCHLNDPAVLAAS